MMIDDVLTLFCVIFTFTTFDDEGKYQTSILFIHSKIKGGPMDDNYVINPVNYQPQDTFKKSTRLLHEAAKRYDVDYIFALLKENHCDVHEKNDRGQNALHVLLEDGFLGHLYEQEMNACVKTLIDFHIDLDSKDFSENTPLSLAVDNAFSNCTQILLDAGAPCNIKLATQIAHTMPKVLLGIFDGGIKTISDESESKKLVQLDWGRVIQFPRENDSKDDNKSFKMKQKETQFLYNLLDVRSNTLELFLNHPLVEAFVYLKYAKMAKKFRIFFLGSILFPIMYGTFIYFLYFERCKIEENPATNETVISKTKTKCDITTAITVSTVLLYLVIGCWTLLELYMQLRVDRKYLTSWRTWVARISLIVMGVTLWPGIQYHEEYNITFQYPIAAIGIFLAWVMFLLQVGLYRKFSIYLEMLVKILLTVLKIILMFLPLLIGFYMGFNLLFNDMHRIFSFIMMSVDVGSEAYDNMVEDVKDQVLWFKILAYTFTVGFVILIVIVFMNFLLALSVQDVEQLKGHAKLASISRTIQNIFVTDLLLPNSVLLTKKDGHISTYDPNPKGKDKKNSLGLPPRILMKITLLLKEKRVKEMQARLDDEALSNKNPSRETLKILLRRIAQVEDKIEDTSKNILETN